MATQRDTDVCLRVAAVAIDGRPIAIGGALLQLFPERPPYPGWSLLLIGARQLSEQLAGASRVVVRTASGRTFTGAVSLATHTASDSIVCLEGIERPRRLDDRAA